MGGNTNVIARLDRHFSKLNEGPCSEFAFLGNEPELKTPWLYAWAGVPWKTRALVRRALAQLYGNTPNGMPGNDDGGVLSAWVVFSGLGIFPEIPAVGGFVVGTPLFSNMVLHLSGGDVAIHAPGAAADTPYVQRVQFNGQDYRSPWISWDALAQGGQLEFVLAAAPAGWSGPPDPPSFDDPGPP
jgi:putative alpha-1,2-mannosidase